MREIHFCNLAFSSMTLLRLYNYCLLRFHRTINKESLPARVGNYTRCDIAFGIFLLGTHTVANIYIYI